MPQQAWSDKQERQYKHVKESEDDRGRSEEKSKEIASRTVNKLRRQSGETSNKTSQGTGNPNQSLDERTRRELYNRAKELNIEGRSNMSKDELIKAIRDQS